jgi:hypothetical protein
MAIHGSRVSAFLAVGIAASLITQELGGRLDTQIMIGAMFIVTLVGSYVFKYC